MFKIKKSKPDVVARYSLFNQYVTDNEFRMSVYPATHNLFISYGVYKEVLR